MKCSEAGCKEDAAYRVKGPDGTVAFLCAKHVKEWSPKTVITIKRYLRNKRCYVALGLLLALTLPFVAYLAYASTNKMPISPIESSFSTVLAIGWLAVGVYSFKTRKLE